MDMMELTYPVFETNQVLTKDHLNGLLEYLDEQNRLTRANLIGVGIACGLEVEFNGTERIRLTKGCGITSQGYLIMEPKNVDLVSARTYTLPTDYGYPPFMNTAASPPSQLSLWELFDKDYQDVPAAVPLTSLSLKDKAVVLFLELRRGDLRTCAPNSCDDRGAQVTATLRRLLVRVGDLRTVIAATSGQDPTYLGSDLTERLGLPDLRMPRFDVPSTRQVDTERVLRGFQDTFRQYGLAATGRSGLAQVTIEALGKLYQAFQPLVADLYPNDPFAAYSNAFGFLDANPATPEQVLFLPYYWDLFDDLIAAYDEVRWKGVDLLCACCPSEKLFPRHLMAGVLDTVAYDAADYRHHFVRSPAVCDCVGRTQEVRQLFQRLVAMLASFTEKPPDKGIRATPSRWGGVPLSAKAIPFYYAASREGPRLYQLWDPVLTSRGRSSHNLGYHADGQTPTPPDHITDPLRFDLEPRDFLRIEGHLGKDVHAVLTELLELRSSHRLPFEVVALRTGAYDGNAEVDLSQQECRSQDLEALYETLKSEMICFLVKQVEYFYRLPAPPDPAIFAEVQATPTPELLRRHDPGFRAMPGTLGLQIEGVLTRRQSSIFAPGRRSELPNLALALVSAMSNLSALLTDDLRQLDDALLAEQYRRLVEIATEMEALRRQGAFDDVLGLSDRLDDIIFRCRLDPFEALIREHRRRAQEARQAMYLGRFLERHPGIQHKAGVPLGGTFILVYHALPQRGLDRAGAAASAQPVTPELDQALQRLRYKPDLADDPDIQAIFKGLTGTRLALKPGISEFGRGAYSRAIAGLANGTVIADFFLPYVCTCGCSAIQFQLPPTRMRVKWIPGCTGTDDVADVALTVEGARGELSVRVDGGKFTELTTPFQLAAGDHSLIVRDATGNESSPVEIAVPAHLQITKPVVDADPASRDYQVRFAVQGGTPPYRADPGSIAGGSYLSPVVQARTPLTVVITDSAGCSTRGTFRGPDDGCELPCGGEAIRQSYRFWLPEPRPGLPLSGFDPTVSSFVVTAPDGTQGDLTAEAQAILGSRPAGRQPSDPIDPADFQHWLDEFNKLFSSRFKSDEWLRFEYAAALATGTTGALVVDRLTCVGFELHLTVVFQQGERERELDLTYDEAATVIVELKPPSDARARIPTFDRSTSNKCRPGDRPVPLCEGTDLTLEIELIQTQRTDPKDPVELAAVADPNGEQPVERLWEVQDGIPSVAGGAKVVLRFDPLEPARKRVRLTGFTEKGCAVTVERVIDIKPAG